ncbi:MAG: polymorphic toxin-type HINT domain-containing protein, partial [Acidimicrobiales bacterium]
AGAVPFAGDVIDGVRCVSNLVTGSLGEAALQCAAAIPVAGNAALALRVGRQADNVLDATRQADNVLDATRRADNVLDATRQADNVLDATRAACRTNSFLPTTAVLGADGVRRPIDTVAVGDFVVATDPATGVTSPRRVTHVIVGRGLKDLVRVSVGTTILTATAGHPFYVLGGRGWVDATDLVPGDALRTPAGSPLVVGAVETYTASATVHNLTVEGVHTYYAGHQPVLVHNCHLTGTALTTAQKAANRQAREAALRSFQGQYYRFGNETFLLDKRGMDHILARHHPRYWNGSTRATQTFFEESATVDDVATGVGAVLQQNRDELLARGTNLRTAVSGIVDGVEYKVTVAEGRVVQFFPIASAP